ncbi:MAG: AraC family transcriptional regulator [Thermoanaerobaculia bacterium]
MNRVELLLRTPAVSLCRFDHPPAAEHHDPDFEVAPEDSINFVEAGSFDIRLAGERFRFAPGSIFVTRRDMGFACDHDSATPSDRCLSVAFSALAVEDLLRADLPALTPPLATVTPRQSFLRHRLRGCAPGEELRLELLAGALFESLAGAGSRADRPPRRARPAPASDRITPRMRRIERALELIESDYARPLTLAEIAAAACLSPFHFARTFRELTGAPPHRHLTAVRLGHAARRLDQGASVTDACYDVGFGSLSHFITAFHRRFGVPPSAVRRGARLTALRAALRSPAKRAPRAGG